MLTPPPQSANEAKGKEAKEAEEAEEAAGESLSSFSSPSFTLQKPQQNTQRHLRAKQQQAKQYRTTGYSGFGRPSINVTR